MKVLSIFGTHPEAIDAGTVKLVGTDVEVITTAINDLMDN